MTITVDEAPATSPPNKYGGDPASFDAAMQAHLDWQASALVTQINLQNAENNAINANLNSQVALVMGAGLANAASNAAAAAANATAVAAVNSVASTKAAESAASALAAAAARDLSIAAWAASTAPAETLAAISQSIHVGTVVKSIIYDTSKDSDGGAWRKRCTDKSWFTETLGGNRWIGQRASVGAAWTAAGSTAGAVYQSTADGKYYSPTSATVQTEVFRGIAREFPEQAAIVAEAGRVVIYDLCTVGVPMFAVFAGDIVLGGRALFVTSGATLTSLAMVNGDLFVGTAKAAYEYGGVIKFSFASDTAQYITSHAGYGAPNPDMKVSGISKRNSVAFWSSTASAAPYSFTASKIVVGIVNDIAVTVLEGAPIDPATGLPVPTIAVATAGGVSVIKHDGTVVNSADTGARTMVDIRADGSLFRGSTSSGAVLYTRDIKSVSSGFAGPFFNESSVPAIWAGSNVNSCIEAYRNVLAVGVTAKGLSLLQDNPAAPTKGMVAAITNAYNSGYQVGDSRGAWLADTVAETITAPELVVNGGVATDLTNWTTVAGLPVSETGQLKTVSSGGISYSGVSQAIPTVAGKSYLLTGAYTKGTGTSANIRAGTNAGGSQIGQHALSDSGLFSLTFTATSATTHIGFIGNGLADGQTQFCDNISAKQIDPDRSVKFNGLSIVGSLTKTAVAAGAQLVAYSGFSAANYLEQPYSANLDFGTGDFCVMGWLSGTPTANYSPLLTRATTGQLQAGSWAVKVDKISGKLYGVVSGVSFSPTASNLTMGGLNFFIFSRRSGRVYVATNGGLEQDCGASSANLTTASDFLRIGAGGDAWAEGFVGGVISLVRISATVPSQSQIEQIYRDELSLFAPGAQCTIAGTSTAVTALAYDDSTDLLHVGTSWGRSAFRGLLRTESEATTTGPITSLSAAQGAVLTGGTSARFYQPALQLRDEIARKEEAKRALGKVPVFFDFDTASFTSPTTSGSTALTASSVVGTPYVGMGVTGTGIPAGATIVAISGTAYTLSAAATVTNAGAVALAQSSFTLQQGYTAKAVYSAEALKREGSTKTYTRAFDGYRETINFAVSPGSAVWVSIMAVRA